MQHHELERSRYMRGRSIVRLGAASGAGLLLCGLLTAVPVLNQLPSAAASSTAVAVAWGDNGAGQLGDSSTTNSDTAVAVGDLPAVTAIAAGENHSLAVLNNGTVAAWGDNTYG